MLKKIGEDKIFMGSVIVVNGINYLFNILMGRILGPQAFADIALIVTMLIILSFFAVTFQMTATKFTASLDQPHKQHAKDYIMGTSLLVGLILGIILFLCSELLHQFLHTNNATIFKIFAVGVPIYFGMSVNRGYFQGNSQFLKLSITYQLEAWIKLILSFSILLLLNIESSIAVCIAIFLSFVAAIFPIENKKFKFKKANILDPTYKNALQVFFSFTLLYELTQITINNSDIILVKMYFNSEDAGLYSSLALVGRLVYFMTWMFVMTLMPKIIQMKKNNLPTISVLLKNELVIILITGIIVLCCFLFSEQIIGWMFGDEFLQVHHLLWLYGVATSLFAVSNVIVYYYISLDKFKPVIIALLFGVIQILLVYTYHSSLKEIILVQILAMAALLITLLLYFIIHEKTNK